MSKAIFFLTIFFILNLMESSKVFGVLPPEFYEREVQESVIKAIAVVEEVKVLSETTQSSQKNVLFNLERSFHKNTPQKFTGTCYSVDHKWQTPMIGGTIHYYPRKKDRALVTISRDSGTITSYTKLTPELEKELNENDLNNISFHMGRALIKNKNSGREFVKIGRRYYKSSIKRHSGILKKPPQWVMHRDFTI